MKDFTNDPRMGFFDKLALKWNAMQNLPRQEAGLARFLVESGVASDECILDVGCGTGTLTRVLLRHLAAPGRVVAVDLSAKMLELARAAISDPRVDFLHAAAEAVPCPDGTLDRVICYSAWPHFRDPTAVLGEWRRLLKPGGHAHVLHLISREEVNAIHGGADDHAIHHDLLVPVTELAQIFTVHGFRTTAQHEDDASYLLSAELVPC